MTKANPLGLLVLYDEDQGLLKPQVKTFSPSSRIEVEVNDWIEAQPDIAVHRIDWLPSGGMLGAAVLYTPGNQGTQSLRLVVPGLERLEKRLSRQKPIEKLAVGILVAGVVIGLLGLTLFYVFYPDTWYGVDPVVDPQIAAKWTVLTTGLGIFLTFAGVAALFRARVL